MPEVHQIREAEIRIFDREPGADDASDMYVMEVYGITVRVRITEQDGREVPKVVVEAEQYPLEAEVCGVESFHGE